MLYGLDEELMIVLIFNLKYICFFGIVIFVILPLATKVMIVTSGLFGTMVLSLIVGGAIAWPVGLIYTKYWADGEGLGTWVR